MDTVLFPVFILGVLTATLLSGCLDDGTQSCFEIPWPAEGHTATYDKEHPRTNLTNRETLVVGTFGSVFRGDGHTVVALTVSLGGQVPYQVGRANNDIVQSEFASKAVAINTLVDWAYGPLLFGQCVEPEATWERPFQDAAHSMVAKVVSLDRERLVVDVRTPDIHDGMFLGDGGGHSYRSTWSAGRPFVDSMIVYDQETGLSDPLAVAVLREQSERAPATPPPRMEDPPYAVFQPTRTDMCYDMPGRQPALGGLSTQVPFEDYLANITEDSELQTFFGAHTTACAVVTTFEIITEPNSTAYLWTSIFADKTDTNYFKRFLVRCFHDPILVVLYGECMESNSYNSGDDIGAGPGQPVDPETVEPHVGAAEAIANLDRILHRAPTRILWRAQATDQVTPGLRPFVGTEPGAGFEIDFGTLEGSPEYITYEGVRPGGSHWKSAIAMVYPNGWINFISNDAFE